MKLSFLGALTLSSAVLFATPAFSQNARLEKNLPVDFSKVTISDAFWTPRLDTLAAVTLDACIDQCEKHTSRIRNFEVAAGRVQGEFKGIFFDDSDVYKMIEGVAYSLVNCPDAELEAHVDGIIDCIAAAQQPDGYLSTYYIITGIDKRWSDMTMHEMYCAGHLIEAAIAYYNATGKDKLLNTAIRFADHIDATFGEGKRVWVPGHQEIELALVKLYRQTGNERYLHLAHWLLEQRGHDNVVWPHQSKGYFQDEVPARDLKYISGHAVRAMYMFTGMADVAAATGSDEYLAALDRLWNDVVNTRMYLTGGIGSSGANEGFTVQYDMPNAEAYCETCASIGMVLWNQRMNMFKGDARYVDIMERCMYNGVLSGISLSGDRFFYVNPLESYGNHHRRPWYGTACCPSNLSRFIPSIGNYVYATSENALWVNMFISSSTSVELACGKVAVEQTTHYPWSGEVNIKITPERKGDFAVKIRIPGWCRNYAYRVSGNTCGAEVENGYLVIDRTWKKGDAVELSLDMPVEVMEADPRVKANVGKRALMRGPIVYCLEQTDNAQIDEAVLTPDTKYTSSFDAALLGGVQVIEAKTGGNTLKFIPYHAWDNRDAGKMKVWIDYAE